MPNLKVGGNMKIALRIIAVLSNLIAIAAGAWATATTLLNLDFYSIFFIPGMSSAESLYFNMIMFVIGLSALMFVIPMLLDEKPESVEFPTIYGIIPLVIGIVNIILAFSLATPREKIIVILASVLYILLSGTIIYNGAKLFEINK